MADFVLIDQLFQREAVCRSVRGCKSAEIVARETTVSFDASRLCAFALSIALLPPARLPLVVHDF